jgi:hypothetical protein
LRAFVRFEELYLKAAAIAWAKAGQLNRRPVIVGIALKRTKSTQTSVDTHEAEDDFEILDAERETFKEIMSMLMDCLE